MVRTVRCLFAAIALVLLGVGPLHAQSASTASIGGTVRDASGGVLPGVTVTATQTETRQARTAVSDGDGAYLIPGLPVGPYRLEFVLSGFRTYAQTGIVLQVNTNPTVNATLPSDSAASRSVQRAEHRHARQSADDDEQFRFRQSDIARRGDRAAHHAACREVRVLGPRRLLGPAFLPGPATTTVAMSPPSRSLLDQLE